VEDEGGAEAETKAKRVEPTSSRACCGDFQKDAGSVRIPEVGEPVEDPLAARRDLEEREVDGETSG
jgi:hypothetical protein